MFATMSVVYKIAFLFDEVVGKSSRGTAFQKMLLYCFPIYRHVNLCWKY